jgi:hypothetical protein
MLKKLFFYYYDRINNKVLYIIIKNESNSIKILQLKNQTN